MIIRTVPNSSLFRVVSAKFYFIYQTSGIHTGKYVCTGNLYDLLPMKINTYYLIENVSIAGSIPESVFVDSVNSASFLTFELLRYQRNELVTSEPIIISQYYKEKTISNHVGCNKGNDGIKMRINGILNQVAETVGVTSISLVLSLSTYEIDGKIYNELYRDKDYQ
jgi:hypothetical protein